MADLRGEEAIVDKVRALMRAPVPVGQREYGLTFGSVVLDDGLRDMYAKKRKVADLAKVCKAIQLIAEIEVPLPAAMAPDGAPAGIFSDAWVNDLQMVPVPALPKVVKRPRAPASSIAASPISMTRPWSLGAGPFGCSLSFVPWLATWCGGPRTLLLAVLVAIAVPKLCALGIAYMVNSGLELSLGVVTFSVNMAVRTVKNHIWGYIAAKQTVEDALVSVAFESVFGDASNASDTSGASPLVPAYSVFVGIHILCGVGVARVVNILGATVRGPP